VCIHAGPLLADPKRPREFHREQYLKSGWKCQALFADLPEACENRVELAKTLQSGTRIRHVLPAGVSGCRPQHTIESFIRSEVARRTRSAPGKARAGARLSRGGLRKRLGAELDVIVQMGFPGYFLIVADFINWAKQHDIPVGPGRGSGAGSLVAYALGITDLDPLRYDLLFERFLNPERVSLPGLRRRLLHGSPRRSHRLRRRKVRARSRQPDHHVRHDGREGRAARHRARAWHAVRPGRPHCETAAEGARSIFRSRTPLGRSDKSRKEPDRSPPAT
jgi:hypothetical protein